MQKQEIDELIVAKETELELAVALKRFIKTQN